MKYAGAITGVIIPAETIGIRLGYSFVSFPIIARLHSWPWMLYIVSNVVLHEFATTLHPVSRILQDSRVLWYHWSTASRLYRCIRRSVLDFENSNIEWIKWMKEKGIVTYEMILQFVRGKELMISLIIWFHFLASSFLDDYWKRNENLNAETSIFVDNCSSKLTLRLHDSTKFLTRMYDMWK